MSEEAQAPVVAVLAVQGAFAEQRARLEALGATCVELRQASDCAGPFCGLVLPGGESTVQSKLIHELGMFDALSAMIAGGMPVLGTCAGAILLADTVEGGGEPCFSTMSMTVRRNAYGRQLGSFHTTADLALDDGVRTVPMTFIRAPQVAEVRGEAKAVARVDGAIVAAAQGNQLALSFHPELDADLTVHRAFLSRVEDWSDRMRAAG
ncbi:MAG: pyridoxal 5'-phosphate synthase glutaminase subunit PdxT [Atopobiaceae bacterium]|jgi:5'-phosphate synthase pdxT subunit|nr:pyridoxal 5'-phosphate synthase glutaminase subunit PdxT [Atopobiaceae bacterium]MCH4214920.1 pyridoxal 5'-phosphate synthase glutaminase subunit PdxT [Atopobiaceae bacterium]MCH4229752.1 pyridoxal 5'-phosphate synthase glutaminase subunit PdxT [Atopobiaceae bacterium]MCH4276051.1 pyridoxal 5'-phosphate synthase glutaminase subunit PdxT [Atopobiaceae bacterium]MCI1226549.1 pyridoxal 5'-phosphate synthase glutaminase subunit PdxT [Atopobiaceae bacterium]